MVLGIELGPNSMPTIFGLYIKGLVKQMVLKSENTTLCNSKECARYLKIVESLEGLTLYDAYVMERMFETFADFRCEANGNSKMPMPSIDQTFIRAKRVLLGVNWFRTKKSLLADFKKC